MYDRRTTLHAFSASPRTQLRLSPPEDRRTYEDV